MTRNLDVPDEYAALYRVYEDAYEQASEGKGKERHASEGEAYEDQIICEVARRVGLGYPLGQAVKKIYESQRLIPQLGVQELLGAINYLAAAVIVMQERMEEEGRRFREGFSHAEGDRCQDGNDQPEEPGFKRGDKVQAFNGEEWVDCRYIRWKEPEGRHVVQYKGCMCAIDPENLRPVSRAEGCEALVEKDAPQTPAELYGKIIASNPATFKARTPTSEELAEMAEEEKRG